MRRMAITALTALLVLLLAACGGGGEEDAAEGSGDSAGGGAGGTALVTKDFSFEPADLTAKAGEETTVSLTNEGEADHNLTISDLGVDEDVAAGGEASATFTAEEAGEFEFVCKFHADQMKGTLTVE